MTDPGPAVVTRLVGVYDADHTLRGELRYWAGARPTCGTRVLLGPDELDGCGGSVDALAFAVAVALAESGLRWPD